MKITLSVIKADIGSIGGHIKPSAKVLQTVRDFVETNGKKKGLLIDSFISSTGDDIAILTTHTRGTLNEDVHRMAWDAFQAGTQVAKEQGLYGAGQDLLKDAFSGNVIGLVPSTAEIEFEEIPNESFLFFAADKTEPGAYNLPLFLSFVDPMHC
ncbi:MAG: fructose 1,6-bisphosphatase, partial [Planctomycetes bacterium]|nr:fructose 1,6-bisphosphatase [Planctomycetota bacterium]